MLTNYLHLTMARSNQNNKIFCVLWFFMLVFFVQKDCNAYQFKVGGSCGWTIPNDSNGLNYSQWAEKNRFQIGDTLVFDYPANKDTVIQVTKEDYNNCHSATPIKIFTNGHTVFKFNQSGPYYFVSGLKDNCLRNEKLVVVVIADRSKKSAISMTPSPSPGSTETIHNGVSDTVQVYQVKSERHVHGFSANDKGGLNIVVTAPPVSTNSPPSPSPTNIEPPSPTMGTVPASAPSIEDTIPPKSGAYSVVATLIGSIGALVVALFPFVF